VPATPSPPPDAEGLGSPRGRIAADVSNAIVRLLRRNAGRGPTKASTTIARDHVLVVVRDTLTAGERTLVEQGRSDLVLETRRAYQESMREEAIAIVEQLTGREVAGFLSANHIDPDVGAELFILRPDGDVAAGVAESVAEPH
jgi:uncharacterized protein YbcI